MDLCSLPATNDHEHDVDALLLRFANRGCHVVPRDVSYPLVGNESRQASPRINREASGESRFGLSHY
jgi:hypothetical protein